MKTTEIKTPAQPAEPPSEYVLRERLIAELQTLYTGSNPGWYTSWLNSQTTFQLVSLQQASHRGGAQ